MTNKGSVLLKLKHLTSFLARFVHFNSTGDSPPSPTSSEDIFREDLDLKIAGVVIYIILFLNSEAQKITDGQKD